jgi:hypothetical protein
VNLNQNFNSPFKYAGSYKFGHNHRTFIDINWNPKEQQYLPAPTSYQSFSEFTGLNASK